MRKFYLKILILAAILGLACTTKVSEWVLLNAPADRYQLVYCHNGTIPEVAIRQNKELETEFKKANILFRQVVKKDLQKPYYALYYKNRLFSDYSGYEALTGMAVSPLRKKIADDLMEGQLCILLYLTTGVPARDEAGRQIITKSIAASPFAHIISVVELNRNSPEEKHFVSMLLNVEEDLKDIGEPMLFGIYGRLRVLEPLLAKGITGENIRLMIDFFTADCSCIIKDKLPGISILYDGNWENPRPAKVNKILDENPELVHH